jgi:L-cysteine desulfidase
MFKTSLAGRAGLIQLASETVVKTADQKKKSKTLIKMALLIPLSAIYVLNGLNNSAAACSIVTENIGGV